MDRQAYREWEREKERERDRERQREREGESKSIGCHLANSSSSCAVFPSKTPVFRVVIHRLEAVQGLWMASSAAGEELPHLHPASKHVHTTLYKFGHFVASLWWHKLLISFPQTRSPFLASNLQGTLTTWATPSWTNGRELSTRSCGG